MTPEDRAEDLALADAYLRDLRDGRLAYRPHEAARLLGVDTRTVERLIATGALRAKRHSARLTLVSRQALYAFLELDEDTASTPAEVAAQ